MCIDYKNFCSDETGATAIEYGLIASLVVIAAIGALTSFGAENDAMWDFVQQSMSDAVKKSSNNS